MRYREGGRVRKVVDSNVCPVRLVLVREDEYLVSQPEEGETIQRYECVFNNDGERGGERC